MAPRSLTDPRLGWSLVLVAALVVWSTLALSIDNGRFGVFLDDGLYLTSARSLRDGRGYGLPSRPGEPPTKYPIGLPLTLALVLKLDPTPPTLAHEVAVARALVILGGWGFFLAAHLWLRRLRVKPALACGIILATAFHHVVLVGGASTLFADLPFAAVAYGLLARLVARPPRAFGWGRGWVDGALAGFGFLLRSNGITLIAASLVASILGGAGGTVGRTRGGWPRLLGCLVGLTLVVVPATWYAGRHPRVVASNSYLLELKAGWTSPGAGFRLVSRNLAAVAFEFPTRVLASPTTYVDPVVKAFQKHPVIAWLVRLSLSAIVALGLVDLIRASKARDLPAWTHAVGSVAIFAAWPWSGILDRLLLSLFPMVLLAFARGVATLARFVPGVGSHRQLQGRLVGLALAAVALGNAAVVVRAVQLFHSSERQWPGAPNRLDLDRVIQLIRDRTEPDAVVASAWPELIYLHTGRTSVPLFEDEASMTRRYGDVSRLKLWRSAASGRPFYLLHRSPEEDPDRADESQIDALANPRPNVNGDRTPLTTQLITQTPNGHFRVSRLVGLTPGAVEESK